jgi:LPS-assembly protein
VDGHIQALGVNLSSNRGKRLFRSRAHSSIRTSSPSRPLRPILLLITTIAIAAAHQHLHAQAVTREEPPTPQQTTPQPPDDLPSIPRAIVLPPEHPPQRAVLESYLPLSRHGDLYTASDNVTLTYDGHLLRADSLTYNDDTGEATAVGHVELSGGDNDEHLTASHGTYNIHTQTGRFYDVTGSVGLTRPSTAPLPTTATNAGITSSATARLPGYQNSNPFLFEGRMVVKTGPADYTIYNGSVTSCLLPNPDWQLFASKISVDSGQARAAGSTFRLLGLPLLFLPYVTHPVDTQQRQSGLLIPVIGYSSASKGTGSKGLTVGEQFYIALGRSADLTVGTLYYSLRGFSENGTFRYRGLGDDFFNTHFSALQDRGFVSTTTGLYTNQGGEDLTASFRRQFTPNVRAVGDAEYLSSYVYREAFTENFNQAVSTDITSIAYVAWQRPGFSLDGRVDRYQGLKVVPTTTTPGEQIKIFHAPAFDFTGLDHPIPGTPLLWSITASAAGLKRVQPNFSTSGIVERVDLRPELALPLAFAGWHTLSSVAIRETAYSRSRQAPYGNSATPVELSTPLSRSSLDLHVDIRPPVLERTFTVPERWRSLFGDQIRHTIEPEITYRNTHGIDNFLSVLRFDDVDLASNTDELQYGLTQHLYFRPHQPTPPKPKPGCPSSGLSSRPEPNGPIVGLRGETSVLAFTSTPDTQPPTPDNSADEHPTTDANGIPNPSATAPDQPIRTHARTVIDPCAPAATVPPQREWLSWQLTQKHFFDQIFGGAVIDQRRNIFDTTLNFSGIAFLTEPRSTSPLVSRLRLRSSSHTDVEWDFDFDTGAKKFTRSNTFLDIHEGRVFGGFSYALLNAPGRFYSEIIDTTTNQTTGLTSSAISDFSQMRVLIGYGTPSQPGFSAAASSGIDLNLGTAQYITIQSSYNWNCCGLSVEYRKYDLGTVRDEGAYRFNFTLANIGTAGNLRRAESLF